MATSTKVRTATPATKRKRTSPGKILATLTAVTLVGVAGVMGTFAALTDTTTNEDNEFNAATIDLADNDADGFMYQVDDQIPGEFVEKCIEISYSGGRESDVELYMSTPVDLLAPYLNLTIEAGSQASPVFPGCAGFAPDGLLSSRAPWRTSRPTTVPRVPGWPTARTASTPGPPVTPSCTGSGSSWPTSSAGPGRNSSGSHNFTWQATAVA